MVALGLGWGWADVWRRGWSESSSPCPGLPFVDAERRTQNADDHAGTPWTVRRDPHDLAQRLALPHIRSLPASVS